MANEILVDLGVKIDNANKTLNEFKSTQEKALGKLGIGFDTIAINQGLELASKAFSIARKIIEKPFEIAFEAEQINKIQDQFKILANQAGLVGDSLREGLSKASAGKIAETDLLEAANRALIQLGKNATKLPETMELARKATNAFGGDTVENFEAINRAIATGNTRTLRQLGIIVDQEKAYRDFAKSIHVSVDALNQAGRQQAILNAVLEKGQTSFKNINGNSLTLTNLWREITVVLKDAGEAASKLFLQIFGPALKGVLEGVKDVALGFKELLRIISPTTIGSSKEKIAALESSVKSLGQELFRINSGPNTLSDSFKQMESTRINKAMQEKIELIRKLRGEMQGPQAAAAAGATGNASFVDPQKAEADRIKVQQIFFQTNNDKIAAQLESARISGDAALIEDLEYQQRFAVIQEFELKRQALQREFLMTGLMDKEQFKALEEQLEADKNAKIQAMEKKASTEINEIQKALRSGVVNGLTSSFAAMGGALAKGANAFQAFSKAIIGAIGNLAIQIGSMLVAVGLGFEAAGAIMPAWAVAGVGTVAAGLALITLGGALSAIGSGGGEDSGGGVSSGSSAGGNLTGGSVGDGPFEREKEKPTTQVVVNVQGNILDRRQTGLELADVINEAFGSNGLVIASGAIS